MIIILCFAWLSAPYESTDILWGLPLFWWARIGKILQFISGLVIVVEIVGVEKVKDFSYSLRKTISLKNIQSSIKSSIFYSIANLNYVLGIHPKDYYYPYWGKKLTDFSDLDNKQEWTKVIGVLSIIFLLVFLASEEWLNWIINNKNAFNLILKVLSIGIIFLLFVPIQTILKIILNLIIVLLDFILIEPTAWFVGLNSDERRAKVISAILFLIGFFLDMLAS